MWNDAAVCTMKETVDMYGWYLTRIMSDCCEKKKIFRKSILWGRNFLFLFLFSSWFKPTFAKIYSTNLFQKNSVAKVNCLKLHKPTQYP